jgi:SAM-dependent methyltransferase
MMEQLITKWQQHIERYEDIIVRDKDYYLTSDEVEVKVQNHVLKNTQKFSKGTVVDIGSNNGFWLLQFFLHGAKKVIGIEPRKVLVDAFNQFAQEHSIPCEMIQGFHPTLFNIEEQIDCVSMMSVDEEILDFDEYIYKIGCIYPNVVLLLQTMLIDTEIPAPFPTSDQHHVAPVKRFKGVIYKFEENNNNHRDGFDYRLPLTDGLGLQGEEGLEASYIHSVYSKDYMEYILDRQGYQINEMCKIDRTIKRPMTQSGRSGKLWWISAKNRNPVAKEPLNLFEYKTK